MACRPRPHDGATVAYPVLVSAYYDYGGCGVENRWCAWPSRWSICNRARDHANQALQEAQNRYPDRPRDRCAELADSGQLWIIVDGRVVQG
jgi:hypothetical protein